MGTRIAESRRELAVGAPNSYAGIGKKPRFGSRMTFEQGAAMQDGLRKNYKLNPSMYDQLVVSCTGDQLFSWKKGKPWVKAHFYRLLQHGITRHLPAHVNRAIDFSELSFSQIDEIVGMTAEDLNEFSNVDFCHRIATELQNLRKGEQIKYETYEDVRQDLEDVRVFVDTLHKSQLAGKKLHYAKMKRIELQEGDMDRFKKEVVVIGAPSQTRFEQYEVERVDRALHALKVLIWVCEDTGMEAGFTTAC